MNQLFCKYISDFASEICETTTIFKASKKCVYCSLALHNNLCGSLLKHKLYFLLFNRKLLTLCKHLWEIMFVCDSWHKCHHKSNCVKMKKLKTSINNVGRLFVENLQNKYLNALLNIYSIYNIHISYNWGLNCGFSRNEFKR